MTMRDSTTQITNDGMGDILAAQAGAEKVITT